MTGGSAAEVIDDGLRRVLSLAARRLERNGLRASGRIRLERVTVGEVAALSGLLGGRWRAVPPGAATSVDLAALDAALRAAPDGGSLAVLAARAAGAPLVDRAAARSAAADARERGWAHLVAHRAVERHPALAVWLERERRSGAATRAGDGMPFALLSDALDVLAALPADPPQTLARFAAALCGGDPHALDRGRPLDGAVSRALAHLDGEAPPAAGAEARRARYDRWGVGCDELTSTVLCLGLRPAGDGPLAIALASAAAHGQPRIVTLRELRGVETLRCGGIVLCCENPAVVTAAADDLAGRLPAARLHRGLALDGGAADPTRARRRRRGGAPPRRHGPRRPSNPSAIARRDGWLSLADDRGGPRPPCRGRRAAAARGRCGDGGARRYTASRPRRGTCPRRLPRP